MAAIDTIQCLSMEKVKLFNDSNMLVDRVFFNNLESLSPQLYLKRDTSVGVSCEFCEMFKNTIITD